MSRDAVGGLRAAMVLSWLGVMVLLGCASGGGGETAADRQGAAGQDTTGQEAASQDTTGQEAPAGTATVEVENTNSSGPAFSIRLVSGAGEGTVLGSVGPQRTESFQMDVTDPATSYRLLAQRPGGADIRSEPFPLPPGSRVHWVLPYNTLHVRE